MKVRKITYGFVDQTFENGKCIDQEFVAGDQVEWNDLSGGDIEEEDVTDFPMNMVQPETKEFGQEFDSTTIPVVGKLKEDGQVEFNQPVFDGDKS